MQKCKYLEIQPNMSSESFFSPEDERARLERIWDNYRKETIGFNPDVEKSLEIAEEMEAEGDLHYAKHHFREALIFYNKALSAAPVGSPIVGILYANRSAVYLASGLPIQCQENIQLALDHGYPADKREKLEERKAKCIEMIEQLPAEAIKHEPKPFWTPVLSHPAHPKFPFLSNAVDIEINDEEGPKLVANEDLRPGDIFLIDPYNIRLLDGTRTEDCFARCAFCTLPCYLSLIPCSGCVHVMYCKDCLPKWEKIHKFECKTYEADYIETLMVRMLVQTLDLYDFDLELLKKDIEEVQKSPKVLLEGDYVNDLNRQVMKWIFPRWNLHSDLLDLRGFFASYLLEKLLHFNAPFKVLVSTRERKITALQVLISIPSLLSLHNQDTYMARYFYHPFKNNFFTHDGTKINSTYSGSHFDFNICLLPVKRGNEIKIGSNKAILDDLPDSNARWMISSECLSGNAQPLFDLLKPRMPASHQVSKNIEISGFDAGFELGKFFEHDLNLCMKNKDRYAKILDKISGHFPCFEVAFVMWLFLVVVKELCVDNEYYLNTALHPDAEKTMIMEETKKIVARILKK